MGRTRGNEVYCPSVAKRIDQAVAIAGRGKDKRQACQDIYDLIGTFLPAYEVVPAAFGVFLLEDGNPVETILSAINVGGDTDTLGAIAGALVGALHGYAAFPSEYGETIQTVNNLNILEKAEKFYHAIQMKPKIVK